MQRLYSIQISVSRNTASLKYSTLTHWWFTCGCLGANTGEREAATEAVESKKPTRVLPGFRQNNTLANSFLKRPRLQMFCNSAPISYRKVSRTSNISTPFVQQILTEHQPCPRNSSRRWGRKEGLGDQVPVLMEFLK